MRDYVFYPFALSRPVTHLSKAAKGRFGAAFARALSAALGNILVFALVGVWHGATSNYILWGLYNGVILAVTALLEPRYKRMNERCARLTASRGFHAFRVLRTFVIVNIGWFFDRCATAGDAVRMMGGVFARPEGCRFGWITLAFRRWTRGFWRWAFCCWRRFRCWAKTGRTFAAGWPRALPIRWAAMLAGTIAVLLLGVWGSGFSRRALSISTSEAGRLRRELLPLRFAQHLPRGREVGLRFFKVCLEKTASYYFPKEPPL